MAIVTCTKVSNATFESLVTIIFNFSLLENDNDGNILALYLAVEENKKILVDIYGPNTKLMVFYKKS